MAQRVLSISLGSEIVKVSEVALAGKNKVQIFNAIDLVIPEGLCEDGVIYDAEGLAKSITEGLKGEGFTAKKIVFSITSKRIANKEAIIPYCKENRIKDIVNINAPEYFPISNLEDYVISHSILDVVQNEGVKNYRLSVVATPIELLNGYYALAGFMKMPVVYVDYSGNSILQLLKLQITGSEVDAIVQMGTDTSVISIMHGKTMVIQRNVPYGRASIFEVVRDSLGIDEYETEQVLADEDIVALANKYPDIADAIRTLFSSINRILEFYSSRNQEMPITNVYMIGDASSINGLVDLFNSEWDYEVSILSDIKGIEIKNRNYVNEEIAANYLANIGALLAPMNIVLPAEEKGKKTKEGKLPWWILIFSAVVAALMIGGILFIYFNEKSEVDSLNEQIAAYEGMESLEDDYELSKSELTVISDWYVTTKGANESLAKFIDKLEEVQPSAVAILKLSSKEGEVTIEGTSYGKPAVAEFIIQLKKIPYVKNVKTEYVNESINDYAAKDSFLITLQLEYDDPYGEENGSLSDGITVEEIDSDGNTIEVVGLEDGASNEEGGNI